MPLSEFVSKVNLSVTVIEEGMVCDGVMEVLIESF